jgi:hypothetical protein
MHLRIIATWYAIKVRDDELDGSLELVAGARRWSSSPARLCVSVYPKR